MKKNWFKFLLTIFFTNISLFASINTLFDSGFDARTLGMGDTYCANSELASSVFLNPAGITNVKKLQVCGMYNSSFIDIKSYFLSSVCNLLIFRVGIGVAQRRIDDIEKTDDNNVLGNISYVDNVYSVVVAKKLTSFISLAVRLKILSQQVDTFSMNGFTLDLGGMLNLKFMSLGVLVDNVSFSSMIGKSYWNNENVQESIPFKVRIGSKIKLPVLTPAVDCEFVPSDTNPLRIYFGVEKWINKIFALRAGFKKQDWKNEIVFNGISSGVTLKITKFNLDYSFVNYPVFGFSHYLMFSINF
jgi:hypothetical protein